LVKGVLEIVSRELTVGPLTDGTVSFMFSRPECQADGEQLLEPKPGSPVEEKQTFQEAIQYRLDIVLALFESAYGSLQSESRLHAKGNVI
jgi:hypothetical protein